MTANGRMGFPSAAAFLSFRLHYPDVVAANAADLSMPNQGRRVYFFRPGLILVATLSSSFLPVQFLLNFGWIAFQCEHRGCWSVTTDLLP